VDMWRKKTLQKEGAVTQHHYGAAAKAIEADRARAAAREAAAAPLPTPSVVSAAGADDSVAVAEASADAAEAREAASAFALSLSDPNREKEKVQRLYQKLIEARSEAGDKSSAPSLKDFERFVVEKTNDLKNRGGQAVEYTVSIEGGRVKLKARISS
jgi:hypothetical protein